MTNLDLEEELRRPVKTLREPPKWFRMHLRQAFELALKNRRHREVASWKLFMLVPRMLLASTPKTGAEGKELLLRRAAMLQAGKWEELLHDAAHTHNRPQSVKLTEEEATAKRLEEAEAKVR